MSESRILKSAELERVQQERVQQIEILSLNNDHADENITKNSNNENEFSNLIDNKNVNEDDDQKLNAITRADQTVRLTEKM